MLEEIVKTVDVFSHPINFTAGMLLFIGGGYIALHSRVLPKWVITSLWYIGLAGLLNAITFIVTWTVGDIHPLSHFQLGSFTESLLSLSIASMVCTLFFHTVWYDYKNSSKRRATSVSTTPNKPAVKKVTTLKTIKPKSTPSRTQSTRKQVTRKTNI